MRTKSLKSRTKTRSPCAFHADLPQGAWVAPPERAVWIPGGVAHAVKMVGEVSTRSVLIDPAVWNSAGDRCPVVAVSALLRSLLVAAFAVEPEYDLAGRDGMVMGLLVAELARAPQIPGRAVSR